MSSNPSQEASPPTNIMDLKPGMEKVSVKARVIKAEAPRVIRTRNGPRTISNAVLGDETGRVEATLWGEKAGTLKEGDAVEVHGAWTTEFRGKVQLNIGRSSEVVRIDSGSVPEASEIPENSPTAPPGSGGPSRPPRRPFGGRRGFRRSDTGESDE
ncbi:OB-fold nucleic acid binding domain-containing protein [Desulfurococcus mucosus]|uniref:Nucleic acid binding OB-fold tRNA/helicase-type n=1 Tax=Desulfurococcus mucosus (strain ATCC 35584 / DSM 2162 / JCM 9187 / O7/1) TaxID=765177 RepID=E8R874_DESM0|nr:OB-fold nucleic acid binding domain-containing protein [Desulfurococcus mucosus]ADV64700.1 nucleic acid binding OB-fold tRNA/helicase-type [Desulfurococcus mucosus DSM 2162]